MGKWLQWIILTSLTGSPLLSLVILVVIWWSVDRFTLGLLPNPVRLLLRWQRTFTLERTLQANPHDRRARLELAELYLGQRRYAKAVETLRPNLAAGDDDSPTLFAMGRACFGAGHKDQAEVFFDEVEAQDPGFRLGGVDLERGRGRLAAGDAKGAERALKAFLQVRQGSVEGRVLLAQALARSGDEPAAALMREEAWREYATAPRFQRRVERFWAWRAKPSRPIAYALLFAVGGAALAHYAVPLVAPR